MTKQMSLSHKHAFGSDIYLKKWSLIFLRYKCACKFLFKDGV